MTYPSAVLLTSRVALAGAALLLSACRHSQSSSTAPSGAASERVQILALDSGVTATIVAPEHLDPRQRVELILYALPNGNTTAQTMGRALTAGMDWHYDIQHIGAQTRALRARGMSNAIVAYLEADTKSWPEWRRVRGYENANARIVAMVDRVRAALGNPSGMIVTLTGHSGGGSFFWALSKDNPVCPTGSSGSRSSMPTTASSRVTAKRSPRGCGAASETRSSCWPTTTATSCSTANASSLTRRAERGERRNA